MRPKGKLRWWQVRLRFWGLLAIAAAGAIAYRLCPNWAQKHDTTFYSEAGLAVVYVVVIWTLVAEVKDKAFTIVALGAASILLASVLADECVLFGLALLPALLFIAVASKKKLNVVQAAGEHPPTEADFPNQTSR